MQIHPIKMAEHKQTLAEPFIIYVFNLGLDILFRLIVFLPFFPLFSSRILRPVAYYIYVMRARARPDTI